MSEDERQGVLAQIRQEFGALRQLGSVKVAEVAEEYERQATILDEFVKRLRAVEENALSQLERPKSRKMTVQELAAQIRTLRAHPDCDVAAVDAMEVQLKLMQQWAKLKSWQDDLNALIGKIEARQEKNRKSRDRARAAEQRAKQLRRVMEARILAGKPSITDAKPADLITVEFELPANAASLLAPPILLPRRLERLFGCVVDRSPERNRQRTLLISILEKEHEPLAAFLAEADWSGNSNRVTVDSKLVPQIIGKGGGALRALEENHGCIIHVSDNAVVSVYGRKADTEKALSHISNLKLERPQEPTVITLPLDHPALARALNYGLSRFVREIEKRHNVGTRIVFGVPQSTAPDSVFGADVAAPSGGQPSTVAPGKQPSITVRGSDLAAVNAAAKDIENLAAPLRCLEIPLDSIEAAKRLFSKVSFNGEIDVTRLRATGSSAATVGEKFADLAGSVISKMAFIRHGDALIIVGPADEVAKVEGEARDLVAKAAYTSDRIRLSPHQVPAFRPKRLEEIETASGATVSTVRVRPAGEEAPVTMLDVNGSEEQKAKAKALIDEIMQKEAFEATIFIKSPSVMNKLLQDQATEIKKLQSAHGVRISADRQSKTVQLIGPESGVESAKIAIQALEAEIAAMVTESVPVPDPSLIGRLIGAKGVTIAHIRSQSGVSSIDIKDQSSVLIRGSPNAVDKAVSMVQEIFENTNVRKKPQQQAASDSSTPATGTSDAFFNVVAAKQTAGGPGWGESVVADTNSSFERGSLDRPSGWSITATSPQSPSAAAPEGFFPAFEEAGAKRQPRTRPRRNARKQPVN